MKTWVSFTVAAVLPWALVACKSPAQVQSIEFTQDSSLAGQIRVEGMDQSLALLPVSGLQKITLPPGVKTRGLEIELTANSNQNLPLGMSRSARIVTRVELAAANEAGDIESVIKDSRTEFEGVEHDNDEVICQNLFAAEKSAAGVVRLTFKGFKSFASCQGKRIDKYDPMKIGARDVERKDYGWFPNFFSKSDDLALGKEFVTQFNVENKGKILPEKHPTTQYVQSLIEKIAANSDDASMKPKAFVINENILNAFALPGGYVYVFRGLIDACDSEAELAGVLGHEMAHAIARHGTKSMSEAQMKLMSILLISFGAEALLDWVAKENHSEFLEAIASVLPYVGLGYGYGLVLADSRDYEYEADLLGSQYAWKSGFEPWGISSMFEIFQRKLGRGEGTWLEEAMSTHPVEEHRIARGYNLSSLFYPAMPSYIHVSPEFLGARMSLSGLPIASQEESKAAAHAFMSSVNDFGKSKVFDAVWKDLEKQNADRKKKNK